MAGRATMVNLAAVLRGMTAAGDNDYTIGTATFWSHDQINQVMDRHRTAVDYEPLERIESYAGSGTVQYLEYRSQYRNFEETDGGSAIFIVEEADGDNVGTASWTADYIRGVVTFGSDTGGTAYYLTGRSYDLNAAAAEIWRHKAAHYAAAFDVKTDNQALSRSQLMKHCIQMADYYESLSGPVTIYTYRTDNEGLE